MNNSFFVSIGIRTAPTLRKKGLLFRAGQGASDRFASFTGTLADVNAAVALIKYMPDENFNSRQHAELLTVAIWQADSNEVKVR